MCKEISWEEIEKQIKNKNNVVLLGNGFSRSYDAEAFSQEEILKSMPSLEGKEGTKDIEELIKATKGLVNCESPKTANLSSIHRWIEDNLRLEFIKALFTKMPKSIKDSEGYSENALIPYRDFLSNFNKVFTLNYDPILYWMTLRLKGHFSSTIKKLVNTKIQLDSTSKIDKKYEELEKKLNAYLVQARKEPIVRVFHSTTKDDEYKIVIYKNDSFFKEKILSKEDANKFFKTKADVEEIIEFLELNAIKNGLLKDELEDLNRKIEKDLECDLIACENSYENVETPLKDGFDNNKILGVCEWIEENSKKQEIFYLHGAYHYFEKKGKTIKVVSDKNDDGFKTTMLKQVKDFLDDGYEPLTVLKDNAPDKMDKIIKNDYLRNCFDAFKTHNGNLITYGVSFMKSDEHIIDAIKANSKLEKMFIGYHSKDDRDRIEKTFAGTDNVYLYCTVDFFKKLEHELQKELICTL